ncbi:hypothetical protein DL93DRAFT_2122196, partial [Clavulina sp. PMI_390]
MQSALNTNTSGGSAAISPDTAEEAAVKTAEAEEALGAPKNNKLLDAGNGITDQYSHVEPLKDDLLAAFPNTISAVEGLLKLGGLIAEIHPVAKVIVGVLKGAWTIIQANAQVNGHMHTLLSCMKDLCVLTKQYATSKEHDCVVQDIVRDISFTVLSGATLINGYAEHQKHKSMFQVPTLFTSFEQDADQITDTLTSLATKLQGSSVASVFSQVHKISAVLHMIGAGVDQLVRNEILSGLPCAADAAVTLHDGNEHECLPGTRTAVLEALQTWAADKLDLTGTKVLWLQGVAGSGKSSIAASVAKFFEHTGILMAYYRFETAKQGTLKPSNLFTTIALQLASQDTSLAAILMDTVEHASHLQQKSQDPSEQLKLFLLPLLEQTLRGYKQLLIIIDALDESGGAKERSKVLKPLANIVLQLPPAVCILITTRPEPDIQEALGVSPPPAHVTELFMHNL